MIHDLIITDNSCGSCLILIYTACGCCLHVSCHVWQSFPVCKIMCMCTRATTGISVLILNAFSSMESEGVSHMRRLVRTLSTPFYKWTSRREEVPSGIFNMFFIETAIDFFSFLLFGLLNLFIFCKVYTREFGKRPLLKSI